MRSRDLLISGFVKRRARKGLFNHTDSRLDSLVQPKRTHPRGLYGRNMGHSEGILRWGAGLNGGVLAYESAALPPELHRRLIFQ